MTCESVNSGREPEHPRAPGSLVLPTLVALVSLIATEASAQVAQTTAAAPLHSTGEAASSPLSHPAINLSRGGYALSYAGVDTQPEGFPRTAITHRLTRDGPVGSVGYLCGIKPFAPDYYGVGAGPASGYDRGLTFLGVKLDYAFR